MHGNIGIIEFTWAQSGEPYVVKDNHKLVWSTNPMWINEYATLNGVDIPIAQHNVNHIATVVMASPSEEEA